LIQPPRTERGRPTNVEARTPLAPFFRRDATGQPQEHTMTINRRTLMTVTLASAAASSFTLLPQRASAASAQDLDNSSSQALQNLYQTHPIASDIAKRAKAVLVFPNIVKAGFVFGGAYGEGVLMESTKVVDYYNTVSASWGLQAGAQSYGYALFLMNNNALGYLQKSRGWEIGVGPTVVVVNEGVARNLSSSTLKDAAYAFIFDQQGLMASLSIEGTKITEIKR
jgi:lipid-binding SYLF domain-containing protein